MPKEAVILHIATQFGKQRRIELRKYINQNAAASERKGAAAFDFFRR
jgi:hypothetical protein